MNQTPIVIDYELMISHICEALKCFGPMLVSSIAGASLSIVIFTLLINGNSHLRESQRFLIAGFMFIISAVFMMSYIFCLYYDILIILSGAFLLSALIYMLLSFSVLRSYFDNLRKKLEGNINERDNAAKRTGQLNF